MNKYFLTILLSILLFISCNPVNRLQKQMTKNEETRAAAAKLCADLFPITDIQYLPGKIDTLALTEQILKLCPISKDSVIHDTVDGNVIILKPSINHDSLLSAIKKFTKPDTIRFKDTAIIVSLQGQLKKKSEEVNRLTAQNNNLEISSNRYKGNSISRLWMLVSALLLLVLTNGAWVYVKFKK